jgi:hypothetical protein
MTLPRLLLTLLCCLFVPARGTLAATILQDVPGRVYDAAGLDAATRAAALEVAAATLAPAGAAMWWRDCQVEKTAATCATAPAAGELVLRIVRSPSGRGLFPASAAQLRSPSLLPLGDAFVDLGSRSGVLATIYLDRVVLLARLAGGSLATLLGRAIAHEIGHLLLASNAHGTSGLMRPIWLAEEVRRGRAADWTFSEREAAAIRTRLEAR